MLFTLKPKLASHQSQSRVAAVVCLWTPRSIPCLPWSGLQCPHHSAEPPCTAVTQQASVSIPRPTAGSRNRPR